MIPRLHINFSAPGMTHLRFAQLGLFLLIVSALALTAGFWWTSHQLHQEIDTIEAQIASMNSGNKSLVAEGQQQGLDLSNKGIRDIPQQVTFVKEIRERVKFSWTQLLTDLESTVPPNTRMRSVSLDDKKNTILLHGFSKSLPDLNQFIHQLERYPAFEDVILSQHATKKIKKSANNTVVVFSMKATYYQEEESLTHSR